MSSDLHWRPVQPEKYETLPRDLKYIVSRRFWNHDGSLSGEPVLLSSKDVEYLNGIKDASSNDKVVSAIEILLEAIEKYGAVEIWLSA